MFILVNVEIANKHFTVSDHANSFRVTNEQNQVTIIQSTPLPESVISDNNFLILNLAASGDHALTTSTTVLLEIIKQDVTTPVFSQNIYFGSYTDSRVDIDNITLVQGLDSTVSFELSGGKVIIYQFDLRYGFPVSKSIPDSYFSFYFIYFR